MQSLSVVLFKIDQNIIYITLQCEAGHMNLMVFLKHTLPSIPFCEVEHIFYSVAFGQIKLTELRKLFTCQYF